MKLPADLRQLLARRYQNKHRDWLAGAGATGDWPMCIRLGIPAEQDALRQVDAVREWAGAWRQWRGAGAVTWSERRWRVLGTQSLPESLTLHDPEQVAIWVGEQERWRRAAQRFQLVAARWPVVAQRLTRLFGVLADYGDADFHRLLDLADWLLRHPQSCLQPRQIPLAGIDSKWLDHRKGIVAELVGAMHGRADEAADFYSVCGLRRPPAQLRIRVLDATLRARVGGLCDIVAPVAELAGLDLPAATTLVVENLQTGLALADLPGTVAVLALGYSVEMVAQLPWARSSGVLYWGDIDTHGYAILHQARAVLPGLQSVLMDEATLLRFSSLCSSEPSQHSATMLDRLTPEESLVYQALKSHRWGHALRLEQERIAWDYAWPTVRSAVLAQSAGKRVPPAEERSTPLKFGLSDQIVGSLRTVLAQFPAVEKAVVYGSRATGAYRSHSDIDIAVMAPGMTDREFSRLWNALDDLPMVFKLDAVHFERVANPRMRENILNEGMALYPAT